MYGESVADQRFCAAQSFWRPPHTTETDPDPEPEPEPETETEPESEPEPETEPEVIILWLNSQLCSSHIKIWILFAVTRSRYIYYVWY